MIIKRFKTLILIIFCLLLFSGCNYTSEAAQTYADEIDKTEIMSIEISVDESDWQAMLENAVDEEYIPADITINGTTIKYVGIRPKGNSSLSQVAKDDTTDRFSFKIKFDEYIDDQTWLGLDNMVINNMYSDATYMKEYLSYDIMNSIGVDAPLFAFADIQLNGETWGLYLAVEDVDDGYLERVKDNDGELYKPDNEGGLKGGNQDNINKPVQKNLDNTNDDINTPVNESPPVQGKNTATDNQRPGIQDGNMGDLDQKGAGNNAMSDNGISLQYIDDDPSSYSAIFDNAETKTDEDDYQRVITAIKNLNQGTELETYVDIDAVLRYFTAHTVVVNLDSYISNMAHNYYLYENDGQISIIPWDYNEAFGGFQSQEASTVVNFPIDTPVSGISMEDRPLLSKLLEVPEYLDTYYQYLQEIIDGYFEDGRFSEKVDQLDALISSYVENDPTAFYTYEEYRTAVVELEKLGSLRADSIQGQLDGTIPSTTEGQRNNPDLLIDASSIDLRSLGKQNQGANNNQNGGQDMRQNPGGNGQNGGSMIPEGLDAGLMQAAMAIIREANNGELIEEQLNQLYELGLTDEQIDQLLKMQKDRQNQIK